MQRKNHLNEQLYTLLNYLSFNVDEAMKLVRQGANPDTKNKGGRSLLHLLADNNNGTYDPYAAELVKQWNANINLQDNEGRTPLLWLKHRRSSSLFLNDARSLLKLGADPNIKDNKGRSLLHILMQGRFIEFFIIKELVESFKANINIFDNNGQTPLQWRIANKFNIDDICRLLDLEADPDTKNKDGKSLLHLFIDLNSKDSCYFINLLVINYRANIHIQDKNGLTPFQYLFRKKLNANARKIATTLVSLGADSNIETIGKNNVSKIIIESLLENNQYNCGEFDKIQQFPLDYLQEKENKIKYQLARNQFLNLLILWTNDRDNKNSDSFLKKLPVELILYCVSFLDFSTLGKTWQECVLLAQRAFQQHDQIKSMVCKPGGLNVFQKNKKDMQPEFLFFKSAKTLCLDFKKLKDKNASADELKNFRNQYALSYWDEHSSLFQKSLNKKKLFDSIKETELYEKVKISF